MRTDGAMPGEVRPGGDRGAARQVTPSHEELARLVVRFCGRHAEALCREYSRVLFERGEDEAAILWTRVAGEVQRLLSGGPNA